MSCCHHPRCSLRVALESCRGPRNSTTGDGGRNAVDASPELCAEVAAQGRLPCPVWTDDDDGSAWARLKENRLATDGRHLYYLRQGDCSDRRSVAAVTRCADRQPLVAPVRLEPQRPAALLRRPRQGLTGSPQLKGDSTAAPPAGSNREPITRILVERRGTRTALPGSTAAEIGPQRTLRSSLRGPRTRRLGVRVSPRAPARRTSVLPSSAVNDTLRLPLFCRSSLRASRCAKSTGCQRELASPTRTARTMGA